MVDVVMKLNLVSVNISRSLIESVLVMEDWKSLSLISTLVFLEKI
jgi:hypothetical protein